MSWAWQNYTFNWKEIYLQIKIKLKLLIIVYFYCILLMVTCKIAKHKEFIWIRQGWDISTHNIFYSILVIQFWIFLWYYMSLCLSRGILLYSLSFIQKLTNISEIRKTTSCKYFVNCAKPTKQDGTLLLPGTTTITTLLVYIVLI